MKRNTVNKASDFIMSSGVSFAAALFFRTGYISGCFYRNHDER